MPTPQRFRPPSFVRRLIGFFRCDRRLAVAYAASIVALAVVSLLHQSINSLLFWTLYVPVIAVQALLCAVVFLRSRASHTAHNPSFLLRSVCDMESKFNQLCLHQMQEGRVFDIENVVRTYVTHVGDFITSTTGINRSSLDVHVMHRTNTARWEYIWFGVDEARQRTDAADIMAADVSIARSAPEHGGIRFASQKLLADDYLVTGHDYDAGGNIHDGSIYCRHYKIKAGGVTHEFILSIKSYDDALMADPCDQASIDDMRYALDHVSSTLEKLLKFYCVYRGGFLADEGEG